MKEYLQLATYNLQLRRGFSLVEVTIAVALVAVILVAAFNLLWQVMFTQLKSAAIREVQQNAQISLRRMETDIRGADSVTRSGGATVFGGNPGKLTLVHSGSGNDVVFDTATSSVTFGGVSVEIRKLQVKVGSGTAQALTSDQVDVTTFMLTDLTRGGTVDTIRIDLTAQAVNPGNDPNREAEFSLSTTVSLRQ